MFCLRGNFVTGYLCTSKPKNLKKKPRKPKNPKTYMHRGLKSWGKLYFSTDSCEFPTTKLAFITYLGFSL